MIDICNVRDNLVRDFTNALEEKAMKIEELNILNEMAYSRKKAESVITGLERPINNHIIFNPKRAFHPPPSAPEQRRSGGGLRRGEIRPFSSTP